MVGPDCPGSYSAFLHNSVVLLSVMSFFWISPECCVCLGPEASPIFARNLFCRVPTEATR
jgi:hypothetical protein